MSNNFWKIFPVFLDVMFNEKTYNDVFSNACTTGNIEIVNLLLELDHDPSANDNYAIRYTLENGHIDVVDRLLQDKEKRVDPSAIDNYAIRMASRNGHIAVVDYIKQFDMLLLKT